MNRTKKMKALAGSVLLSLTLAAQVVHADSVQFSSNPPYGTTTSISMILFSVNGQDDGLQSYEVDISPGMSGNDVVTSMDNDMAVTGSYNGVVAGNTLTVDNVCDAEYIAPGHVGLSMNIDTSGCGGGGGGGGIVPLDLPLAAEKRRSEWAHIIFIGDEKGKPTWVNSAGYLGLTLIFSNAAIDVQVPLHEGMNTSELARALDDAFARSSAGLGEHVIYTGLDRDGWPTFESRDGNFTIRSDMIADTDSGVHLGAAVLSPAIEPTRSR